MSRAKPRPKVSYNMHANTLVAPEEVESPAYGGISIQWTVGKIINDGCWKVPRGGVSGRRAVFLHGYGRVVFMQSNSGQILSERVRYIIPK